MDIKLLGRGLWEHVILIETNYEIDGIVWKIKEMMQRVLRVQQISLLYKYVTQAHVLNS